MSKIKLLTIAVIGLLLLNLATIALVFFKAPNMRPFLGPPMGQGPQKIIEEKLDFDAQQKKAYRGLIAVHQATIKQLGDSIRIAKIDLYQSLTTKDFEGKQQLIEKLGRFQQQIEEGHFDHFVAIKKLCRPDQLSNYNDLTKDIARFFDPQKKGPPPPRD